MPAYDYDCAACGRRFEVIHGVHADGPSACPLCGGGPVRKAITAAAIHYRGSGWAKKERRATSTPGQSKAAGETTSTAEGDTATDAGASDASKPAAAKGSAAGVTSTTD